MERQQFFLNFFSTFKSKIWEQHFDYAFNYEAGQSLKENF